MSLYRGLFFTTLAGMAAGMIASVGSELAMVALAASGKGWVPDTITLLFFGIVCAICLFLYFDKLLLGSMRASSVGFGFLCGGIAAAIAALLAYGLHQGVAPTSPTLARIAVWALCFSLIGLGLGLRWIKTNRARILHTYAGGLVGGLLAGLFFVLFAPHISAGIGMSALMIAGAGTGFGAGIAPVLVREGSMRFVSSGDARAQNKLGKVSTIWDLNVEDSYVLGSAMTVQGGTRFQQGADIVIPDAAIAPRHAVVFSKDGRFFIARHPDAGGSEGVAKYVLRIKGKTVLSSQELHPLDDLLIGRTALRFESKRKGEA